MGMLLIASLPLATDLKIQLESLVQAERAFNQLSIDKGIREAFLANLSEESIIFRPRAVKGKPWFESNPAPAGQLTWQPEFADISNAGDLGYTTGPFRFQRTANADSLVSVGHYVTIWRRQSGGQWKVLLDTGIGGDLAEHRRLPQAIPVALPRVAGEVQKARSEKEIQAARASLVEAERRFATTSQNYAKVFADDARLYRDGSFPWTNPAGIRKALAERQGGFAWKLGDAGVSTSADLGYAYGVVEFETEGASTASSKTFNYLRIWKRRPGEGWKVVLDLLSM